jgi:hypothetical protein
MVVLYQQYTHHYPKNGNVSPETLPCTQQGHIARVPNEYCNLRQACEKNEPPIFSSRFCIFLALQQ